MKLVRKHPERRLFLDMTPMIDIVFQLLIFFLTTAQMATLTRAEVELPREQGEERQDAESAGLIVNILATGEIIVSDRTVSLNELEMLIRQAIRLHPKEDPRYVKVTIRADRRAHAATLNEVIERLRHLGVGAASFSATTP